MKNILKLSNYMLRAVFKKALLVYFFVAIFQLLLLCVFTSVLPYLPYELLLETSFFPFLYWIGYISLVAILCNYWESLFTKSGIYTILTLPIKRRNLFFAFAIPALVVLFSYWALQLLTALLYYIPISQMSDAASQRHVIISASGQELQGIHSLMQNGLFLAAMRSSIFRLLLPIDFSGLFFYICMQVEVVCFCILLCFATKKHSATIGIFISYIISKNIIDANLWRGNGSYTLFWIGLLYIAFSLFCFWRCSFALTDYNSN